MTLDEAIEHAEEVACGNDQCAKDHAQLADWLRELRRARMEIDLLKTLRDGFKADAQKYKAENEKLRDELRKMDQWHSAELTAALDENTKLRNLVVKAHTCKTDEGCCGYCYQDKGCCPIECEMREIGIEVDS